MLEQYHINADIDHFAVFGNPVKHSKSPQIHSLFARQFNLHLQYQAIEVGIDHFSEAVSEFAASGGKGLNITVPFKEQAFQLCDELSSRARDCQSVNTIWFDEQQRVHGDTTDGEGLVTDLQDNHHTVLSDKRILILGAGGTVRSILTPLLACHPAGITIVNRTVSRVQQLASQCNSDLVDACSYTDIPVEKFDIIINATSMSLHGELPPVHDKIIANASCCYDLMYSDNDTIFMQHARQLGVSTVLDGLGMLVEQAAAAFHIWYGMKPDTAPVIRSLR